MEYAIVQIGGRQFLIEKGKHYDFNRLGLEIGEKITFDQVLLYNDTDIDYYDMTDKWESTGVHALRPVKEKLLIGKPYLKNVKIKGTILRHLRDKKMIVYKMRPKKKTRKKQGHRQELTRVMIDDIVVRDVVIN